MIEIEPINKAIGRIKIPSYQERLAMMRKEIVENPLIQQFLKENDQLITRDMFERSLPKLYEYVNQSTGCCKASNTDCCTNLLKGFVPKLYIIRGHIDIQYEPCNQTLIEEEHSRTAKMISSMHMPKDVLKATIRDVHYNNTSRLQLGKMLKDFMLQFSESNELPSKGLYIHGKFGVGKSFILGAIANELATKNIQSVLVYVPEFLRELKSAIGDNTLEDKINFVKKAPVLMLDDLGSENITAWTRDEILATILHYRMSEKLPTFISSNFDYDKLEDNLAITNKGDNEKVKAARIMERIKVMTIPIEIQGDNLRNS